MKRDDQKQQSRKTTMEKKDFSFVINAEKAAIVMNFVSTEATRYYLNGISVEPNPNGGVTLVATDGHRLVAAYDPTGYTDKPYIVKLPKICVARIKKEIKYTDGLNLCANVPEPCHGEVPAFLLDDQTQHAVCSVETIDGTFPDWRAVMPTSIKSNGCAAGFRACYLGAFDAVGRDITVFSDGERKPALVAFTDRYFIGVLMPKDTDAAKLDSFSRPAWCENPADAEPVSDTDAAA